MLFLSSVGFGLMPVDLETSPDRDGAPRRLDTGVEDEAATCPFVELSSLIRSSICLPRPGFEIPIEGATRTGHGNRSMSANRSCPRGMHPADCASVDETTSALRKEMVDRLVVAGTIRTPSVERRVKFTSPAISSSHRIMLEPHIWTSP